MVRKPLLMLVQLAFLFALFACNNGNLPPDSDDKSVKSVLFEWNRTITPISNTIAAGTPVYSGFGGIYFRSFGSSGIAAYYGALNMTGDNRLVIVGAASSGEATGADIHVPGAFDLSDGTFRLTIDYNNPAASGSNYVLRVSVNNNQTGQAESVLGISSNICQYRTAANLQNGDGTGAASGIYQTAQPNRIIIEFTPDILFAGSVNKDSLGTAFIALNCQGGSKITVTGIKLEKLV